MQIHERVAPHIPFLRRHARAVTGSQDEGDARVAAVLERLIAAPGDLGDEADPRPGLYRLFHETLDDAGKAAPGAAPDSAIATADRRLATLPSRARQALLLVTLEDFSDAEAARILSVDEAEIADLVAEALAEIQAQTATDVLIIEDEPLISADLEDIVVSLGHRVTAVARTRDQAVARAGEQPPGLVLADIQLADGSSGIDAVRDILASFQMPVIFITAFPQRLLTGERPEPAFLLTKPYREDTLKATIGQALFFHTAPPG